MQFRQLRAQVPAQFDTVPVGQADVEDDHVRRSGRDPGEGFPNGGGFAYQFEIGLGGDERGYPPADDFVVVHHEHAYRQFPRPLFRTMGGVMRLVALRWKHCQHRRLRSIACPTPPGAR